MKCYSYFLCFLFALCGTHSKSTHEKLLVVSYDGFRYDYLDLYRNMTPVLNKLKASSTYAKCLLNVFPTQTFPNHFSLATGVYTGVHGVLASNVFDKVSNSVLHYSYELFHYKEDIIPIWALNEKAGEGRHSGVIMWPGSNYEYGKVNSTFNYIYDKTVPFKDRVSKAMSWFTHKATPANFIMMYFEQPDSDSHTFGPYSPENQKQIQIVDELSKYIMESLRNNNLTDVNVVFLSDHGMESVTINEIIDLRPLVGKIADMYGTSPVLQVYPKSGVAVSQVYQKLNSAASENKSHFKVYLQRDIPEHFHMKDCKRAPPILAVADPPYAFHDLYESIEWQVKNNNASANGSFGVHGYDPESVNMHPYFIAHGPSFKGNYNAGELRTVDMFSLFAHVLKLEGPKTYKTNGSFDGVANIFKSSAPKNLVFHAYILTGSVLSIIGIFGTAALCLKKRKRKEADLLEDVEVEKLLENSNT